ncbi:hypothetical protein LR48_Vigan05g222500 [Vigna angularis]|uniref:Uncharacterized protein n=1 Tax=Phaseolus angularis TaxID=3914 RepID=A0A0L9UNZ7_PHAAN|nr:hypothetical protein LR48_Vigan05g222500 [Vigna angularis]
MISPSLAARRGEVRQGRSAASPPRGTPASPIATTRLRRDLVRVLHCTTPGEFLFLFCHGTCSRCYGEILFPSFSPFWFVAWWSCGVKQRRVANWEFWKFGVC